MKKYSFQYGGYVVTVPPELVRQIKDDGIKESFQEEKERNLSSCRDEVVAYLMNQDDSYFAAHGTTKDAVLNDQDLIARLADEHYRNVYKYGCDPEWSVGECCDNDPGLCDNDLDLEQKLDFEPSSELF